MNAPCSTAPVSHEEGFVPAKLGFVRRCPARSDYVELCFTTPEGRWKWCFPEPPESGENPEDPASTRLALTVGRYGAQAHLLTSDGVGPGLPSATALPMILGGAEVHLARQLLIDRF